MTSVTLSLPILAGVLEVAGISVTTGKSAYAELLRCGYRYSERYKDQPISAIPGVQNARKLFRQLGIEPTRHRPSSEAMLRRFLKGKSVVSINMLVDISNWCALDFLLPNGAYDHRKIAGDIQLRQGQSGEEYTGLNRQAVHLEGRFTLADDRGPFGSPITDSERTCVDMDSTDIISILYAPPDFDRVRLREHLHQYAYRMTKFCGGRIDKIRIIAGIQEVDTTD